MSGHFQSIFRLVSITVVVRLIKELGLSRYTGSLMKQRSDQPVSTDAARSGCMLGAPRRPRRLFWSASGDDAGRRMFVEIAPSCLFTELFTDPLIN